MTSGAIVAISVASLATTAAFVCAAARALAIALETRVARNGTEMSARMEAARADDQHSSHSSHPALSEAAVGETRAEEGANDSPSLSGLVETLDHIVGELRVVRRSNQSIQLLLLQSIGSDMREPTIRPRKRTGSRYQTATEYFKPGHVKSPMLSARSEHDALLAAMKDSSEYEEIA